MEDLYAKGSEIPLYLKIEIFAILVIIIVLLFLIIRKINYRIKTFTL